MPVLLRLVYDSLLEVNWLLISNGIITARKEKNKQIKEKY
jgi:hypothetical protein